MPICKRMVTGSIIKTDLGLKTARKGTETTNATHRTNVMGLTHSLTKSRIFLKNHACATNCHIRIYCRSL